MRTSELIGPALDWAVMKIEKRVLVRILGGGLLVNGRHEDGGELPEDWQMAFMWHPSTDWAQGGPIIEREEIQLCTNGGTTKKWEAVQDNVDDVRVEWGPTLLIAAMRCFVASNLGDEVDIPEELK
jgi:hypothetical protein